ncbi:MAG TPA: hypothetical protein VN864_06470 [Thermoplasmata archaeon]|nr:hypothetical protein [Thermoplasmata archaeon]
MAPTSVAYAIDLYLAFLTAATGASLIAFVPSAIRILQPNAVLFPMAALAAVFVASLVAIPFGAGVPSPSGSFRRIAELGPVAFGTIALLALVPPYLPGGLGLYLSGVTGLAAGTLVVLLWAAGGSSPRTRTRGSLRYLRAVVPAIVLAGTIAVTYWLASWELPRGVDLSTPGLGTYGIALAAVAMVGTFAGLMALDLGGRFAAALNAAGEATPASATRISPASLAETPDPGTDRFTAGVRVGLVLAMGLASLVLVTGFLSLVPLEAGVAPGTLVVSLTGGTEGRLLVGAALGLLIPVLTATVLSYREAPLTPGAPSSPAVDPIRLRLGRSIGPLLLGIGIPVLAGSTLGAAGLVGVVLGALLGTLWHGFSSEILLLGPAEGGPPQILVPTMALAVLTALAFGAALYSGSFAGAL